VGIERQEIIARLTESLNGLTPQMHQAAVGILDRPEDVALSSMRGFAAASGVAPATLLRLARHLGFPSYETFRHAFQQALRTGGDFASRAEWLQKMAADNASGEVLSGIAMAQISNIESAYRETDPDALAAAADCLRGANTVFVLGVAALHGIMRHFHFVCRFALPQAQLVSSESGNAVDGLIHLKPQDALLTVTVSPYARQSVESVLFAKEKGASCVVITDRRSSPVAAMADHLFLTPTGSPQFFPSLTASLALLESLTSLIVSRGDHNTVEEIDRIDRLRAERGVYWSRGAS